MLARRLKKPFLGGIILALMLGLGVAFLPVPTKAQSLSITLEAAPAMRIELLKSDGNLNQNPTICEDSELLSDTFLPNDAFILLESRCRKLLLDGAAYNIKFSPLFQMLKPDDPNVSLYTISQSLAYIHAIDYFNSQEEVKEIDEDSDEATPDKEIEDFLRVTVELGALYPNLSDAIKAGVTDFSYQTLLSIALNMEAQSLEKIEKKLKGTSSSYSDTVISFRKEFDTLQTLQLFRENLFPPKQKKATNPSHAEIAQTEQIMSEAAKLDPTNPLIFYILGENQLKSARAAQAVTSFTQTLKSLPKLTPALIGRGTAYLRLNLMDLAIADYNEAIKINAEQSTYYMARASAWLIKKDYKAMCKDFKAACSLGECSGYDWAIKREYCN